MSKKEEVVITPEMMKQAENKMGISKARLLIQQPFYGVLLSMVNFKPEPSIPTMSTDGSKIYYSPKFVIDLPEDEVFGVLLHEISHCIYLHCTQKRRMNRDPRVWNLATDFAVNLEIKNMGHYKLPHGLLLDEKYANMNAEQIYDKLSTEKQSKLDGMQTFDIHIEDCDSSNWDDMEDKIISAYEMSKNCKSKGDLPSGIKRWIEHIRNSRVKWERVFWKYVGSYLSKDDYSYSRVNRRFLGQDIYLPDLRSHIIGNVVVGVDTSGSMGKESLTQIAAEIMKIGHLVNDITVLTADCQLYEVIKVQRFQNFIDKIHFRGGGGTSFKPFFEYIKEKERNQIELCIICTDLYGDQDQIKRPPYPVLWCSVGDVDKVPFGEIIKIPNKDGKGWY